MDRCAWSVHPKQSITLSLPSRLSSVLQHDSTIFLILDIFNFFQLSNKTAITIENSKYIHRFGYIAAIGSHYASELPGPWCGIWLLQPLH